MALCHVTGTVYLPDGSVAARRNVEFYKLPDTVTADYLGAVVPEVITVRTSAGGDIDVHLITGNYYGFVLSRNGKEKHRFAAIVPESATADFADLIEAVAPVEPLPAWLQQAFEARDDARAAVAEAEGWADAAADEADRAEEAAEALSNSTSQNQQTLTLQNGQLILDEDSEGNPIVVGGGIAEVEIDGVLITPGTDYFVNSDGHPELLREFDAGKVVYVSTIPNFVSPTATVTSGAPSAALRYFAAEPYDSVAAVLASKQITSDLIGQRIFTKDGYCFEVVSSGGAEITAGGAHLVEITRPYDPDADGASFKIVAARADITSLSIQPNVQSIHTKGYYVSGDGGEATYKRVESEPSHDGKVQSADGAWWELVASSLNPMMFGARGDDPLFDDGPAISSVFDYVRTSREFNSLATKFEINLLGKTWNIQTSINATGIECWNLTIRGGILHGRCTGKAILDLVGSRGYKLVGVGFYGDKVDRPSCAYQLARPTASGFCDNQSFEDVSTWGYFSRTAIHCYGHETATHLHCTYFNFDHNGQVAIFEGYSGTPFTSDYSTVMSGQTSFINNKVINCDFRYLPTDENIAAITGITKGAITTVTCANGHSFTVGDRVTMAYVGGMPEASTVNDIVTDVTPTTVTISRNSAAWGAYSGGGNLIRAQHKPTVTLSRFSGFNFDASYIVAYGAPPLQIDFPDSTFKSYSQLDADLLFEGSGISACIVFNAPAAAGYSVLGARITCYSPPHYTSFLALVGNAAATISIYGAQISSVSALYTHQTVNDPARFAFYGSDVVVGTLAQSLMGAVTNFSGTLTDLSTGQSIQKGNTILGELVLSAPPISTTAGSLVNYLVVNINGTDYKIPIHA